jgi:uncharacterized protein (TIGR03083 family)
MSQIEASWNFMDPTAKGRVLGVLKDEISGLFDLVADPERWQAPTACEHWEVRDVIGHLVDTTEGYLPAFALARSGGTAHEPHGLKVMAELVDEAARSLRKVPREELLERLHDDASQMMKELEGLSDDDWTGFIVGHNFMGPLPAMFYAVFQIVDYAVHSWDIREGLGQPHGLSGDASDILIPVIHILWQATADVSGVDAPFSVGVRSSGHNGGDVRFDVSSDGVQYAAGDISDLPAILEFDPATLVLTAYGRFNGGTVWGDRELAGRFRSLFFPI